MDVPYKLSVNAINSRWFKSENGIELQKKINTDLVGIFEAALEKVRSRSLAMHKTDELQEVVAVVAEKLHELGVIFDAGGVILCTYFTDNKVLF